MKLAWVIAWAVLAVLVDVSLARVAFGALVPSLRSDLGLDLVTIGTVSAANAVGYLVTSALSPWLGRFAGMRRLAIVAHVVAALGFAGVALAPNVVVLVAARALSGIGGGVGIVACLRLALDAVEPRRRVFVSTLAWSGGGLGLILAALAQPWLHAATSWRVASAVCAALALAIALGAPAHEHRYDDAVATAAVRPPSWRWQGSAYVLAAYFLFGFGFLAYGTFATLSPAHVTPFVRFMLIGVSAVAGSLLVARVRHAERAMATALVLGACGALLTLGGSPFGDVLFGVGLTAIAGLATAILRERAGSAAALQAIAISTLVVGAGQIVGPLVAGAAAQRFGIAWVPGTAFAAYAAGAVLAGVDEWIRLRRRPFALESRDVTA